MDTPIFDRLNVKYATRHKANLHVIDLDRKFKDVPNSLYFTIEDIKEVVANVTRAVLDDLLEARETLLDAAGNGAEYYMMGVYDALSAMNEVGFEDEG